MVRCAHKPHMRKILMDGYVRIYIYIYIVIYRQTVSFYKNSSVWIDTRTLEAGIETRPTLR